MFSISKAYISICDLLIIFSHHNETESPAAGHLVYKPDTVLIKQLENFIQRQVFVGNDDPGKIKKKWNTWIFIYFF